VTYLDELRDVIRRLHDAEATHIESVPVKEIFEGETVWEGIVEVFDLVGHPTALRAYAWAHDGERPKQSSVAVLHIPPITSPAAAVRAALVEEFKSFGTEES
jgi:hypothetical protein